MIKILVTDQTKELNSSKADHHKIRWRKKMIMKRNEKSLYTYWYSIKRTQIWFIGIKEEPENAKKTERLFKEIRTENFLI